MLYTDRIYGKVKITEPVILDIIKSRAFQRLKGIDQAGYRSLWVKPHIKLGKYDHSRFAHSIGVYVLLKKYNASPEEQIAGLIHDLSHIAFSHCADYYFKKGSQKKHSHQDRTFRKYILNSEISGIIKKHHLDLDFILDDRNFPLKEKQLPDLCADRIDYSLRTAVIFGEINNKEKEFILDDLSAEKGKWIFSGMDSAKKYAELFLKLNTVYYSGFKSALMFQAVGDYIKHALKNKYIFEEDLFKTDAEVISMIKKNHRSDRDIKVYFDRMNNRVKSENNPKDFDARVFCKSRIVDPLCRHNGKIKRLSQIKPKWKKIVRREMKPKEYFIKFLN